jgi:predicted ATP-dependent endonuclease of OLD family
LLAILRTLGPDILIATHSPEIVTEAEIDEIVVVDKTRRRASRIRNPDQLQGVFRMLGSAINPVLTQLAKTRRALFVEGADFQILGRFARKLGLDRVGGRAEFAVVPVGGFNPERIRDLKKGMEETLGGPVTAAAVLDRDYRSDPEKTRVTAQCLEFCDIAIVHDSKEIENFLLVPDAIDRAASARLADRALRQGKAAPPTLSGFAAMHLAVFADEKRSYVASRYVALRRRYERDNGSSLHEDTVMQREFEVFEDRWRDPVERLRMIPGKDALSYVNQALQEAHGVNVTPTAIIEAMRASEVPQEMRKLLTELDNFRVLIQQS